MSRDKLIEYAIELQGLAQTGLYYGKDPYDQERYTRIRDIAAAMISMKTELPLEKVKHLFCAEEGYPTPKVDTRAAIFQNEKILLVRESDGTWSLPGGWCEVTLSPVENTIKEAKEEAGRDITVESVIAVQNRDAHNLPPYAYGVIKIFYLCKELGGAFHENIETTAAAYFSEQELPPLAQEKCNEEQVKMCFQAHRTKQWRTQFD